MAKRANGDYECSEKELEAILIAKMGTGFEQCIPSDANLDDIDFDVIQLYRVLRSKVRPNAEELQVDDSNMLHALQLTKKKSNEYLPNLAGLILFGKTISLRRLLPAIRVDYVRIQGTEWVEEPEQRFTTTLDLRESMIRLISRLETIILDDMPYHFQLEEGKIQRADQPLLPQKVIREAVVNALMHRDYGVNQPILIVRYRNRLEIQNPGYSLKPMSEWDQMGSKQRNPIIASVLYDLNFAETKGSGIRTMQKLLEKVGLEKPVFVSNRESNQFTAKFLLHQLLDEEQFQWLTQFNHLNLSNDEAKVLMLVKEMGAIDNAALREMTDLDTLSASQVLRKLSLQYKLIEKGGSGPASYYKPTKSFLESTGYGSIFPNKGDLGSNKGDLGSNKSDLSDELSNKVSMLTPKARAPTLRPIIVELCLIKNYTAEELSKILSKGIKALKSGHLTPMRKEGLIEYLYPKVVNHPEQAYRATNKGKKWLEKQ